ncbi:MAG: hypothetical protein N3F66_12810 [Spirochaetes bacterium]|nr:hypothetical protein [Spirochaetota bacterium]
MTNFVNTTKNLYEAVCINQKKHERIIHAIINNTLYRLYVPLNGKDPELLLENVISYCHNSQDDFVLFNDGTVAHVQSGKTIRVDDAFKVHLCDVGLEKEVLVVGNHTLTNWNVNDDKVQSFAYNGNITDGYMLDKNKTVMIISDGVIFVGGIKDTTKIQISGAGYFLRKLGSHGYLFADGFLYKGTYIDIGCVPEKVVFMPQFAVVLVHSDLFAFVIDGTTYGLTYFEYDNEIYDIYYTDGMEGLLVLDNEGFTILELNINNYNIVQDVKLS